MSDGFLRDPLNRGRLATACIVILFLGLAVPFLVNAEDRHLTAYRDGEEDVSLARDQLAARAARVDAFLGTPHELASVEAPANALLVIVGVERRYSASETEAILTFLRAGGHVILADEGGFGTDIAKAAGYSFVGIPLLDTNNHGGDARLVVTTARLGQRDYPLLLNAPTGILVLQNANPATRLAESSPAAYPDGSFLDRNGNGRIDIGDPAAGDSNGASFPLIVQTDLGPDSGKLVLVADTGLFMNAQLRLSDYDNDEFIRDLVSTLIGPEGRILIDEGRHAPPPALATYDNGVRTLARVTATPLAALATLALVLAATAATWWFTRETEDWSVHPHNLGLEVPVPEDLRPDLDRAQRMARRAISEKYNMPLEQVAAMSAEQLQTLTGDKLLAEAAAGTLRGDPAPLFRSFSTTPEATR